MCRPTSNTRLMSWHSTRRIERPVAGLKGRGARSSRVIATTCSVDADQHYYEADDCFTRHLEQKYRDQAIEVRRERDDGLGRIYRADKRFRRVAGPMGDRTSPPGVLREYFKSEARLARSTEVGIRASDYPEFVDRQARLRALDAHEVEATPSCPRSGWSSRASAAR